VQHDVRLPNSASRHRIRTTLPYRAPPLAFRFEPPKPDVAPPRAHLQPRPSRTTASLPARRAAFRSFEQPPSTLSRAPREPSAAPRASRAALPVSRASPGSQGDALAAPRTPRRPPRSLARTPGGSPRTRSASPHRSRSAYLTARASPRSPRPPPRRARGSPPTRCRARCDPGGNRGRRCRCRSWRASTRGGAYAA
jgi:hypothetical protein